MEAEERKRVGSRITRARRESGLTQRRLAELLGITTRSVQNYESGAIVPWRHLGQIELITRKRPGWLLRQDDGDGRLDTTISDLRRTMEQHQALLRDHLDALTKGGERLQEQREIRAARERGRELPPPDATQ